MYEAPQKQQWMLKFTQFNYNKRYIAMNLTQVPPFYLNTHITSFFPFREAVLEYL